MRVKEFPLQFAARAQGESKLDRTVVFKQSMVQSKCGWSPYEGETLAAAPEMVVVGGRVAMESGQAIGRPAGQMLSFGG